MGTGQEIMKKAIRTVCGDVAPDKLGYTSVHDHTLFQSRALTWIMLKSMPDMIHGATAYRGGADLGEEGERRKREHLDQMPDMDVKGVLGSMKLPRNHPARKLKNLEFYKRELEAFAACGGKALCDCSPLPSGEKLAKIQELSKKSGIHIISCAGYYTKASIAPGLVKKGEGAMQRRVEEYLERGDGSCDARPGFVKCAVSALESEEISRAEIMAVRACAAAAKNYGMSLHIHTQFPVRKVHLLKLADMLEKEMKMDPGKVVFCHMDSYNMGMGNPAAIINADGYELQLPLELAQRGFYVGLDTWSVSSSDEELKTYNINIRKKMLLDLIAHGCTSRITLGHDFMGKANGVQNGGFGYTLFPKILDEMVKKNELDSADVHQLTVKNPLHLLQMER